MYDLRVALLLHLLHALVELVVVGLLQVLLDRPQNARERLAVQHQQFAVVFGADRQRPLVVVDERDLAEVGARAEVAHVDEAFFALELGELEALDLALLDDVELFAFIAFSDN